MARPPKGLGARALFIPANSHYARAMNYVTTSLRDRTVARVFAPTTLALALCLATSAHAEATASTTATEQAACLATADGQTTQGMIACYGAAEAKWNAEVESNYKQLSTAMPKKLFLQVKKAQKLWKAYVTAEIRLLEAQIDELDGTLYLVAVAVHRAELAQSRADALARTLSFYLPQ